MTKKALTIASAALFLLTTGCIEATGSGSQGLFAEPAGDYEDIYYHNCIGYDGDDENPSENPSECTKESDCAADCPSGKSCTCDKSCGCCVVEDWDGPKDGDTYYRYMWNECPADGSDCPATVTIDNQYTWFSTLPNVTTSDELVDDLCMMHVEVGSGCIYKTTASGKNCSSPSTGGAGKYECGNKVCAGNEVFQCTAGPTGKFTYTLVGSECTSTPEPSTCSTDMYGNVECEVL